MLAYLDRSVARHLLKATDAKQPRCYVVTVEQDAHHSTDRKMRSSITEHRHFRPILDPRSHLLVISPPYFFDGPRLHRYSTYYHLVGICIYVIIEAVLYPIVIFKQSSPLFTYRTVNNTLRSAHT
ncbi:hypothetical protein EJ05DRAFT_219548 [Pseudovirgaria hyperparasitica]|uniref:Uncharacterized protein n=1 Tax=Pseudovirgaria hyperparasitica TaxID=470096 RepID=A0A6A6VV52_9PEZI|nr:uncharacterized protein EJ05DRAFT_219548 [Pseudovirgaria hyperparasitica]KAF2753500.1 hypothetical protein EJ05DRAFT_219548 [Pseudovirgaria hyperparasitica]